MDRLRSLGILGIAALVLLTTGTGGVGTISAEQSVGLSDPSEGAHHVGVEANDPALSPGTHRAVPVLQLINRFERPVSVELTFEGDGAIPPVLRSHNAPDRLGVSERATVMATVDCYASPGDGAETWTVEVNATGDGVNFETTRSVTVTCSGGG
jgi:hypothetical protein